MSFKSGVILILLSAAAWGLGGVCGQFLYQFHGVTAPWLIAVRQVLAGFIFLGYLLLRGENIFRIFADGKELESLQEPVSLQEGSEVTFVRLTMLAGRMW